ncbi:hypothetical protein DMC25_02595 [Caulobacter sp. D4A]|uniref:hypothetical protein n=1 Tax=unclassified Caulobacter TaxID=2648921 RepID=UPI000D7301B1|nr:MULTISPECIES: hypothetical protein [unclassified Caulobacter]PXA91129.1 hypothetical protein DMC18_13795 [Caulobacter sp. D5]PXA94301.1 hypothetical protein DMC25_02595 [Caulobacter sp. D4A]
MAFPTSVNSQITDAVAEAARTSEAAPALAAACARILDQGGAAILVPTMPQPQTEPEEACA